MIDASIRQRLLPGLFPPPPRDIDAGVRRLLLALLGALTAGGIVGYVVFPREAVLVAPLAVAAAGVVLAIAVPWHRFSRDAFATVGVAATVWVAWLVWLTGGTISPYTPLNMLAVAVSAIPLSHRLGIVLGVLAAATAGLPLLYNPTAPTPAENAELLKLAARGGRVRAVRPRDPERTTGERGRDDPADCPGGRDRGGHADRFVPDGRVRRGFTTPT